MTKISPLLFPKCSQEEEKQSKLHALLSPDLYGRHACTQLRHFPEGVKGECWLRHSQIAQKHSSHYYPENSFLPGPRADSRISAQDVWSLWHPPTSGILQDCAGTLIISIRKIPQVFGDLWVSKSCCHWWSGTSQPWSWKLNWTLMTHFPTKSDPSVIFYVTRQVFLYFPALK